MSLYLNSISTVKPTRCTIFKFTEYHSTCFGWSFRPSSGVQDCTHSIRYMSYRLVDCMLAGTRWNQMVKIYGNRPKKLFVKIMRNSDVRMNEFPLFFFPLF